MVRQHTHSQKSQNFPPMLHMRVSLHTHTCACNGMVTDQHHTHATSHACCLIVRTFKHSFQKNSESTGHCNKSLPSRTYGADSCATHDSQHTQLTVSTQGVPCSTLSSALICTRLQCRLPHCTLRVLGSLGRVYWPCARGRSCHRALGTMWNTVLPHTGVCVFLSGDHHSVGEPHVRHHVI